MPGAHSKTPLFARLRATSLDAKLIVGCGLLLLLSLALAICLIGVFLKDYRRANDDLEALTYFGKVLNVANRISAERGPANSVLGEQVVADSPARQRLAAFRAQSDAALAAVANPEAAMSETAAGEAVAQIRDRLRGARAAVDAAAAAPLHARDGESIQGAIRQMFDVVDVARLLITETMVRIVARDQALAGELMVLQMLGDMREYAGRMGSHLATPIATQRPLSRADQDELRHTRGRLLQIWQMVEKRLGLYASDPELGRALRDTGSFYFGDGLDFITELSAAGMQSGDYGVTAAQMTDRYVPSLQPLERLRSAFLHIVLEQSRRERDTAWYWLQAVSVIIVLIVLTNLLLILLARRLVFRPLLRARDHVVALAEGREIEAAPGGFGGGEEMRELFGALDILRQRLRERRQLTAQLKRQAETDGLTGLLNRRALERIGQGDPEFADMPHEIGLILMDVDHFKAINDLHGHPAGDQVLREIAALTLETIRESDLAARYGGEEIALILPGASLETLVEIAERLRSGLERRRIESGTGERIAVTASLGVASGRRGQAAWEDLLKAADAALYRAKAEGRNRVRTAADPGEAVMAARVARAS